ncbi:MAG: septum formation initiator family protein [Proteobacteria bacterium]|nr:septum formation initiator family protein [Pseudomonadota bacterium]NBX85719.1 septum formation initiator family protein [Pseudomonadota bacterium]
MSGLVLNMRQLVQQWFLPVVVALLLLYTADQLFYGERGIVTWRVMKGQVLELRAENVALKQDIAELEARTLRMKPQGDKAVQDLDFLDELVRRDLGYVRVGEQVILMK